MADQNCRAANCSYVRQLFTFSSAVANHDPVDAIGGVIYAPTGNNSGDKLKVAQLTSANSTTITAGDFPVLTGTEDVAILTVAGDLDKDGVSGLYISYGDKTNGTRLTFRSSFGDYFADVSFGGASTLTGIAPPDTVNPHGHAVLYENGKKLSFLIDGVEIKSMEPNPAFTGLPLNPEVDEMILSNADLYVHWLFVFPDGVPSDYKEAFAWMSEHGAYGDLRVFPAWEGK